MRIHEVTENFDEKSKAIESLIRKLFYKSIKSIYVTHNVMNKLKMMPKKHFDENQWLTALRYLDEIISLFDKAVKTFAAHQIKKDTYDEINIQQTLKDILLMSNAVHKLRDELPNTLLEDVVDFKAANGQMSSMSGKRPETKKDSAKIMSNNYSGI
jgi:hypothetical protein